MTVLSGLLSNWLAVFCFLFDETSNAVQLNGFFGKRIFIFLNLFSQTTLPVYLFVSWFVNLRFLSHYLSALNIFKVLVWTLQEL